MQVELDLILLEAKTKVMLLAIGHTKPGSFCGVKTVVPRIYPNAIQEMMNKQDCSFKSFCFEMEYLDECDETPPNCVDDTEESNTEAAPGVGVSFCS